MMLSSSNEALEEKKILILYILEKVARPISNDSLLNIVLATTDINYFYCQQFLLDLIEKDYIKCTNNESTCLYQITPSGKQTLKLTQDIIPGIIKLKVDANFKEELDSFENEHSVIAEYTPKSENHYTVCCKIVDNNDTIFEVKTFAGSRQQAKDIVDNWKNNAEKMYPEILNILTNKEKNP